MLRYNKFSHEKNTPFQRLSWLGGLCYSYMLCIQRYGKSKIYFHGFLHNEQHFNMQKETEVSSSYIEYSPYWNFFWCYTVIMMTDHSCIHSGGTVKISVISICHCATVTKVYKYRYFEQMEKGLHPEFHDWCECQDGPGSGSKLVK